MIGRRQERRQVCADQGFVAKAEQGFAGAGAVDDAPRRIQLEYSIRPAEGQGGEAVALPAGHLRRTPGGIMGDGRCHCCDAGRRYMSM